MIGEARCCRYKARADCSCFTLQSDATLDAPDNATVEAYQALFVRSHRERHVPDRSLKLEECDRWWHDLVDVALSINSVSAPPTTDLQSSAAIVEKRRSSEQPAKRPLDQIADPISDAHAHQAKRSKKLRFRYAGPSAKPIAREDSSLSSTDLHQSRDSDARKLSWADVKSSQKRARSENESDDDENSTAEVAEPNDPPRSPVSIGDQKSSRSINTRARKRQPVLLRPLIKQSELDRPISARPLTPQSEVLQTDPEDPPKASSTADIRSDDTTTVAAPTRRKKAFALKIAKPTALTDHATNSSTTVVDVGEEKPMATDGWSTAGGTLINIKRDPEMAREWTEAAQPVKSQTPLISLSPIEVDPEITSLNTAIARTAAEIADLTSSKKAFEAAIKLLEKDDSSRLVPLAGKWRQVARDGIGELLEHTDQHASRHEQGFSAAENTQRPTFEHDEFEPTHDELLAMGAVSAVSQNGQSVSMTGLIRQLGIDHRLLGEWDDRNGTWSTA